MVFHVGSARKGLGAALVMADKGPLAGVGSLVLSQPNRTVISLCAARIVAAEGLDLRCCSRYCGRNRGFRRGRTRRTGIVIIIVKVLITKF